MWHQWGLEPLCANYNVHFKGIDIIVPPVGIEPTRLGLQPSALPTELKRHIEFRISPGRFHSILLTIFLLH